MYYLHYTYIIPFKGHILHLKGNTFFNFVKFSFKFWYTIINSLYRTKIEIQFTSFVLLLEALLLLAKNISIYRNNRKLSSLKKQENALNLYEQAYIDTVLQAAFLHRLVMVCCLIFVINLIYPASLVIMYFVLISVNTLQLLQLFCFQSFRYIPGWH